MCHLTARQREVAKLVAEGLSYQQIGERLHISDRTVRRHVEDIADKLDDDGRKPYKRVMLWGLRRAS